MLQLVFWYELPAQAVPPQEGDGFVQDLTISQCKLNMIGGTPEVCYDKSLTLLISISIQHLVTSIALIQFKRLRDTLVTLIASMH